MVHHSYNLHIYQPVLCPTTNCAAHVCYDREMAAVTYHCTCCHSVCPSTARTNLQGYKHRYVIREIADAEQTFAQCCARSQLI